MTPLVVCPRIAMILRALSSSLTIESLNLKEHGLYSAPIFRIVLLSLYGVLV